MAYNPYHRGVKRKTQRRPSSEHISGRRKTWLSLGDKTDGRMDTSPRLGFAWWKSPMFKEARLKKAAQLRG